MRLVLSILLMLASAAVAYTPSKGIPDPATDLGYEIDVAVPAWPASWLTGTTTATAGYYFVAPDDPAATNTDNTYGHPDLPRANLPHTSSLAAGNMVWIKGGTYVYATGVGLPNPGIWDIYCNASAEEPLWIVGDPDDRPNFRTPLDIGSYGAADHIILCNMDLSHGSYFEIRPRSGDGRTHKATEILIRNCTLIGKGTTTGDSNGIVVGGSETGVGSRDFDVENIVVYGCTISNFGAWDSGEENDYCGVYKAERSNNLWVLGCEIFHCGGDAVAGSALADADDYKSHRYWIGGNELYECGENSIDLKGVRYIVVSENEIYGPMGSQQGGGAIFHAGGPGIVVQDVACIFNTFHGLSGGIACAGSPAAMTPATTGLIFIGNTFHNMDSSIAVQADNNLGFCISSTTSAGTVYVADNSMEDYEIGVLVSGPSTFDVNLHGNIFGTKSAYAGMLSNENKQWVVESSMVTVSNYNSFKGTPNFVYDGGTRNFAYLQGEGMEANSLTDTDPLFTNAATGVLTLQAGSPAIDASTIATDAYDEFQSIFGIDIRAVDKAGTVRPQGAARDIGAFEGASEGGGGATTIGTLITPTLNVGVAP